MNNDGMVVVDFTTAVVFNVENRQSGSVQIKIYYF